MKIPFVAFATLGAVLAAFGQVSFKHGADGRVLPSEFVNVWIVLGLVLYLAGTALFLMLSGGGSYGAWGSGFLNGWAHNAAQERPRFDLVTGSSTGAA